MKSSNKNCIQSLATTNAWTVCKHFSSTDSIAKLLWRRDKPLIMCRGQFIWTTETEEGTEFPASQKKFLRKNYKKHFLLFSQKTKSMQTSGSVFADRIEQIEKAKFELKLIKNVECFRDGLCNYASISVSFSKKSLYANIFLKFSESASSLTFDSAMVSRLNLCMGLINAETCWY